MHARRDAVCIGPHGRVEQKMEVITRTRGLVTVRRR